MKILFTFALAYNFTIFKNIQSEHPVWYLSHLEGPSKTDMQLQLSGDCFPYEDCLVQGEHNYTEMLN